MNRKECRADCPLHPGVRQTFI